MQQKQKNLYQFEYSMVEWVQLIFCRILKMICKGYIATQSWKCHSHANTTLAQLYVALRTEIWLMAVLS